MQDNWNKASNVLDKGQGLKNWQKMMPSKPRGQPDIARGKNEMSVEETTPIKQVATLHKPYPLKYDIQQKQSLMLGELSGELDLYEE